VDGHQYSEGDNQGYDAYENFQHDQGLVDFMFVSLN